MYKIQTKNNSFQFGASLINLFRSLVLTGPLRKRLIYKCFLLEKVPVSQVDQNKSIMDLLNWKEFIFVSIVNFFPSAREF